MVPAHPIFALIRKEHQVALDRISAADTMEARRALIPWLWREVEMGHHLREELFLYPLLLSKARLREGGPHCMLYFSEHLSRSPGSEAEALTGCPLPWQDHHAPFRKEKSPLDIPLEEHRAMHLLAEEMMNRGPSLSDEDFLGLYLPYVRMLRRHSEKEEHCFFHLVSALLSNEELDKALANWNVPTPTPR